MHPLCWRTGHNEEDDDDGDDDDDDDGDGDDDDDEAECTRGHDNNHDVIISVWKTERKEGKKEGWTDGKMNTKKNMFTFFLA